ERAIHELVDVRRVDAIAFRIGVLIDAAVRIHFTARAELHDALVEVERTHGLHVHRAGNALADQRRFGRLVYDDTAQQFRRILIEFDRAVVAGRDLLAAVQQRAVEVAGEAADAQRRRASGHALRGDARQARQRFGDGIVRQLADVFGRNRFDDLVRVEL